jgi:hypothetical protein
MTQMVDFYTSASTATPALRTDPVQDLQHIFPWTATSIESAEQAWFWTSDWQAGERQVDVDIAAGNLSPVFDSIEDFFSDLDDEPA